jgi:hypothetical protein
MFFTSCSAPTSPPAWRLTNQPANASLAQVYGVSLFCVVGFTMSLFIGMLAFPTSPELESQVKVGVLLGSTLSAIVGATVIFLTPCQPEGTTSLPLAGGRAALSHCGAGGSAADEPRRPVLGPTLPTDCVPIRSGITT